jgi:hypothetical protein
LALEREELLYGCHVGWYGWCGSESFGEVLELEQRPERGVLTWKRQMTQVINFESLVKVNQEVKEPAAEVDGFSCSTMLGSSELPRKAYPTTPKEASAYDVPPFQTPKVEFVSICCCIMRQSAPAIWRVIAPDGPASFLHIS